MNVLRRFLLNNLGLKATSVLLAFLLWYSIAGQVPVQGNIRVPIEFINDPQGLESISDIPNEVTVTVLRPRSVNINPGDIRGLINLGSIREPGTHVVSLGPENFNVPLGVSVENVTPSRIQLDYERTVQRIVSLQANLVGSPAAGYQVREVVLQPGDVTISGPESHVDQVGSISTGTIALSNRQSDFQTTTFVDLKDDLLRIDSATTVRVAVFIEEERQEVRLGRLNLKVLPAGSRVRMSQRSVEVVGSVPESFTGEIESGAFQAVLDLKGVTLDGELEVAPSVIVPEQYRTIFRVESVQPPRVMVRPRSP